jgi:hypothetical protein
MTLLPAHEDKKSFALGIAQISEFQIEPVGLEKSH